MFQFFDSGQPQAFLDSLTSVKIFFQNLAPVCVGVQSVAAEFHALFAVLFLFKYFEQSDYRDLTQKVLGFNWL